MVRGGERCDGRRVGEAAALVLKTGMGLLSCQESRQRPEAGKARRRTLPQNLKKEQAPQRFAVSPGRSVGPSAAHRAGSRQRVCSESPRLRQLAAATENLPSARLRQRQHAPSQAGSVISLPRAKTAPLSLPQPLSHPSPVSVHHLSFRRVHLRAIKHAYTSIPFQVSTLELDFTWKR